MLSERDIKQAPSRGLRLRIRQLPPAKWARFSRHLTGCRYCQGIIDEYSQIGGITKNLPPHVEPSADLEDRTVAAMAEQRAAGAARPFEDEADRLSLACWCGDATEADWPLLLPASP